MRRKTCAGAYLLAALASPGAALAQRTSENAVLSSDDAFGTSMGLETTGIYTDSDTRGFSPAKAGNARVDGIYYDPVGNLPFRVRVSTAIRVGFAALAYPFPAPTGIVEHQLRPFPSDNGVSLSVNHMPFGAIFGELDGRLLLNDHIGLTGGVSLFRSRNSDGSSSHAHGMGIRPMFRLGALEIAPYLTLSTYNIDFTHPLVVVATGVLPEFPTKRLFLGQSWAAGRYHNNHAGVTLKAPISSRLSLRAGLFRSQEDRVKRYTEVFSILDASGLAGHRLIADPSQETRSTSGEAQVLLRLGGNKLRHRFIAGFRGRDRLIESGGSDVRDLGLIPFGTPDPEPEPVFAFAPLNVGHVRQSSWLLGYVGSLAGTGSLNLGVQKTNYRARSQDGRTGATTRTQDSPWLYNILLGVDLAPSLSLYLGTERGLEDSGAAPENAANRNAQLPATRSTQYEGGLRWKFSGGQLAVNAFQITKPYFSFDSANIFTQLGDVRNRGVEASLSGAFLDKRLTFLAGAVAMQPRVSGGARDLGLIGERPAGIPSFYARLDANYRTDIFGGLTPTATLTYTGKRAVGSRPLAALGGNQLMVPGALIVDLGLRQRFKIGKIPASIRAVIQNVFDEATWKVVAANTLYVDERRRLTVNLTTDF